MTISREWATPMTIGAFLLMAVTGILMFFHLDTGLNKEAHEWLGWAMVAGVALHSVANWGAFTRHLGRRSAQAIVGVFALVLMGSFFIQPDQNDGNPAKLAISTVLSAPLSQVARLSGQSPQALSDKLTQAGFKVASTEQSLAQIAGQERDPQMKALRLALTKTP
jgi:peptidoglycan/LPS O-acetylase OafA/YrhL